MSTARPVIPRTGTANPNQLNGWVLLTPMIKPGSISDAVTRDVTNATMMRADRCCTGEAKQLSEISSRWKRLWLRWIIIDASHESQRIVRARLYHESEERRVNIALTKLANRRVRCSSRAPAGSLTDASRYASKASQSMSGVS